MGKKLYVGNLAYAITDDRLREIFSPYGEVTSAKVVIDRDSGRSKGFGFVEFAADDQASAAISALHESDIDGRKLNVSEARPQAPRDESGFRGGGGGGRSGGFGGGGGGGGRGGFGGGGGRGGNGGGGRREGRFGR